MIEKGAMKMLNIKMDARMTDEEMEQVAGGLKYYDLDVYTGYKVYPINGGEQFTFRGQAIDENLAAAIVFYKYSNTKADVQKWLDKGWDEFEERVLNYRFANSKEFEAHYTHFRSKED